jgi:hypothetical protein
VPQGFQEEDGARQGEVREASPGALTRLRSFQRLPMSERYSDIRFYKSSHAVGYLA